MSESLSTQKNGLRTYRPPLDKFIFGSEEIRKRARIWLEGVPTGQASRAALITGNYGLGKTTLALALCDALHVHENDIQQINCGAVGGVDNARAIVQQLGFGPTFGDFRVFLLDEVHKLTKEAQSVFLTPIESLPQSTILMACTSEPENFNPALRSRFYEIRIEPYSEEQIIEALENLPNPPKPAQMATIAKMASGNMRRAIGLAEGGTGPDDQQAMKILNAIEAFYPLLLAGEFTSLMFALTQINDQERPQFFKKTLALLEGSWMTLNRQLTTLPLNEQRLVTQTLLKLPQVNASKVGRYYRELAAIQNQPIEMVKAWVMSLPGS